MGVTHIPNCCNIYLPASFFGSCCWATEQISDSFVVAAMYGPPTFFVMMTWSMEYKLARESVSAVPRTRFYGYSSCCHLCIQVKNSHTGTDFEDNVFTCRGGGLLYCIHSSWVQRVVRRIRDLTSIRSSRMSESYKAGLRKLE